MRKYLIIIIVFNFLFIPLINAKVSNKKVNKTVDVSRSPNQVPAFIEEQDDLLTLHNCRIVVNVTFNDQTDKVWLFPYQVRTEADCKIAKNTHKINNDPNILKKNVVYIWVGSK